jgi:hypothetical protein
VLASATEASAKTRQARWSMRVIAPANDERRQAT